MDMDELEFESDSEVGEDMDLDRIPEDQEEDSDEVWPILLTHFSMGILGAAGGYCNGSYSAWLQNHHLWSKE